MKSLEEFIKKIPKISVPEKLTQKTLSALGYKSSNDRPIITILKFINFLNSDCTPTENYINFRSARKSKKVMASCLKTAYKDLFALYSDAHQRSTQELKDFFSTRVTGGDLVLNLTTNTFKTLCDFADFEAPAMEPTPTPTPTPVVQVKERLEKGAGLVINLNIQLELPATQDATVYDKIFESLKKHLLTRD